MLGYAVALVPLYFFVYLPISSMLYGPSQKPSDPASFSFNLSLIAPDEPLSCRPHSYTTHILSQEPLVIYIEGFLSPDESDHLLKIRYSMLPLARCIRV
jgi:prolyl 4-hydroxylase